MINLLRRGSALANKMRLHKFGLLWQLWQNKFKSFQSQMDNEWATTTNVCRLNKHRIG